MKNQKRIVAARTGDGRITVVEQEIPPLKTGSVLVEVHCSLISPGTELRGGWRALFREKASPEPFDRPKPFGYSNAGVVRKVAEGVEALQPGDRVACIGAGYALHSNYAVVPHRLCVRLPDNVDFARAVYGMLAATSLHGLRRGEPEFGEMVAVVGLGIVGQVTAQLYQLAGNFVIGWELIPKRAQIAKQWGIHKVVLSNQQDSVEATLEFTEGKGLDASVFAFPGDGQGVFEATSKCLKLSPDGHRMGRIVILGNPSFQYKSATTNIDIRRAARTGPGYHDEKWEYGPDYPEVFMRWTTRTNLELCIRLISEGKLDVDCLTTHRIPLDKVEPEIERLIDAPDEMLGVVLCMNHAS